MLRARADAARLKRGTTVKQPVTGLVELVLDRVD
jgi:hypothetical protein